MKKDEKMSIEDMTAYMRIVPERKASYAEFPDTMNAVSYTHLTLPTT